MVKIKVIDKEFYCRRCDRLTVTCLNRHRSGIWFKIAIDFGDDKIPVFVVGAGEREHHFPFDANVGELRRAGMSGCETYEHGHITCGGWFSVNSPILQEYITREEFDELQEINLSDIEKTELWKVINTERLQIVLSYLKDNYEYYPEIDFGSWSDLIPIVKAWFRCRSLEFDNVLINEISRSFTAVFKYGSIRLGIPKSIHYEIYRYFDGYKKFYVKDVEIYFDEVNGRKIIYLNRDGILEAYEEYNGHLHPRALIRIDPWWKNEALRKLFYQRLGDILFLKENETKAWHNLTPAIREQFEKIKCIRGSIEYGESIVVRGERITLYHPEHGLLELPKGEYTAYRVPYTMRGHE